MTVDHLRELPWPPYCQDDAAKTLARKVPPDMKAVEHSGELDVRHENWLSNLDD